MRLKQVLQRIAKSLGYHIERIDPIPESFKDQRRIMRGAASVIFDGGANSGDTALRYSKLFPTARIYAFEPGDNIYSDLVASTSCEPRIIPRKMGLAENSGERTFHLCAGSVINSLLPVDSDGATYMGGHNKTNRVRTVAITTTTIDDFCSQEGIE